MIGVIGNGFVGKSIVHVLKYNKIEYKYTDLINSEEEEYIPNLEQMIKDFEKVSNENCYFICVPTPSTKEGDCELSTVISVLKELKEKTTKKSHIIIKSTVKPGTTRKFNRFLNDNGSLYFCPEFLREASFLDDSFNAQYVLIGCKEKTDYVETIFKNMYKHRPETEISFHDYEICEMMKYTINTYLASKIQFFNEIYFVCEKIGIKYGDLKEIVLKDKRIVDTHMQVPGPDGKFSFGGKCLPKEIRGMKILQEELGLDSSVFSSIIERNKILRPNDKNVQGSCIFNTDNAFN